jgi:hypothetical protein|tara:strand:- start:9812 stop:10003 length:192 start_codon:yes stop_codon:yes gene_type:complete
MQEIAKPSNDVSALELHEQICAIRYENLEKRLESGSARFVRIEYLIWGLYGVLITSGILGAVM